MFQKKSFQFWGAKLFVSSKGVCFRSGSIFCWLSFGFFVIWCLKPSAELRVELRLVRVSKVCFLLSKVNNFKNFCDIQLAQNMLVLLLTGSHNIFLLWVAQTWQHLQPMTWRKRFSFLANFKKELFWFRTSGSVTSDGTTRRRR